MSVAALWNPGGKHDPRGRGALPAPTRATTIPAQDPTGPIGLTIELYLGALGWTDVSQFVLYRDSSQLVTITRGRPDEASAIQPQTATFQINNRDARFTPRNPTGPYYGYLTRNTPVRISRTQNGVRRYRFHGEVPEWPTNADISGNDVWIDITASGMLRRLNQGTAPTLSAMYRALIKSAAVPYLAAYWPCEDTVGAATIASAISGAAPLIFSTTPTFASNTAFACSSALPVVNKGVWNGVVPAAPSWTDNSVRFLIQIPAAGDTDGAVILRFQTTGSVASMELFYNTSGGGTLGYRGFNASGTQLWSVSGLLSPSGAGWNGVLAQLSLDLVTTGSSVLRQFQCTIVDSFVGGTNNATLSSSSVGSVTRVIVDPNANLVGTTIGHISVQTVWDDLNNIAPALFANNFETATQRIQRLAVEENLNLATAPGYSVDLDPTLMGNQTPDTFLAMVQDSVDVDGGILFEARDQLALAIRPLMTLYNQATVYATTPDGLTLDYAQHQLSAQPVPRDDDFFTLNDVTITQSAGTSARAVQSSGALSVQAPPSGVGPYSTSISLNTGPDGTFIGQDSTADYAGWRLHMGTVDEPRYPSVSINLRHPQFTGNLDLMNAALVEDIGDVLVLKNPPPWLPPDPARMIVQGYSETMGIFEHDIIFNGSPESPYRVAVFDDWVLSREDTDGSTLAAPVSAAATLLSFATTNSASPAWTQLPGDFPFDVAIGGERVTVGCPGTQLGDDPFLTAGTANYSGQGASLSMAGQPFPTNADHVLNPYLAATLLVTPNGGASADVVVAAPTPAVTGSTYTVWAWVYNATGRSYYVFANWFLNGSYVSTSFGTTTAVAAGQWALLQTSVTAPASVNQIGIGVNDPGTPAATDVFSVFGLNATLTASLAQSSPQQFTVMRSVNAVTKPQSAGTDVRLWQPAILSL